MKARLKSEIGKVVKEGEGKWELFCWKDEGKETKFISLVNSGTSVIEQHEHTSRVQIIDKGKRKDSLWAGIRTWGFPDVKNNLYLKNLLSHRKGEHFSWAMPVMLVFLYSFVILKVPFMLLFFYAIHSKLVTLLPLHNRHLTMKQLQLRSRTSASGILFCCSIFFARENSFVS